LRREVPGGFECWPSTVASGAKVAITLLVKRYVLARFVWRPSILFASEFESAHSHIPQEAHQARTLQENYFSQWIISILDIDKKVLSLLI
jgi:hypothetical protein